MISRLMVFGLALLALSAAGCLQREAGEQRGKAREATTTPVAGSPAGQPGAEPGAESGLEGESAQADGAEAAAAGTAGIQDSAIGGSTNAAVLSPEERTMVRDLFLQLYPEYGLDYDVENDALLGPGLPAGGLPLAACVDRILPRAPAAEGKPPDYEPQVRTFLKRLQEHNLKVQEAGGGKEDRPGSEAKSPSSADDGDEQAKEVSDKPHFAEMVVGDWRSIREESAEYVLEHDEQYYEIMLLQWEGPGIFQNFRHGELFSRTEYPYSYDPQTGQLALLGKQGEVLETMTVYVKDTEPELIYVKRQNQRATLVFKNIGRGGRPLTDEEIQEQLKEMGLAGSEE